MQGNPELLNRKETLLLVLLVFFGCPFSLLFAGCHCLIRVLVTHLFEYGLGGGVITGHISFATVGTLLHNSNVAVFASIVRHYRIDSQSKATAGLLA